MLNLNIEKYPIASWFILLLCVHAVLTESEGTAILDTLAGRRSYRGRVSGEFLLNGNPVTLPRLGARIAYVRRDYRMHPDITVAQTMRFHALLRKPIRNASLHDDKNSRVS